MLFRVYEHYYYNDEIDYNESPQECLVCLEFEIDNGMKSISLNDYLYNKSCNCNAWIHESCLTSWLKKNNKCPICRIQIMEKNKLKYTIYNINIYWHGLFISSINLIYQTTKITIFFILFYFSFIYFTISVITQSNYINKYRNNSNNYQYEYKYENIPYTVTDFNYIEIFENLSNNIISHPIDHD